MDVTHVLFPAMPDLPAVPASVLSDSGLVSKDGEALGTPDPAEIEAMVRDGRAVPSPGLVLGTGEWVCLTRTGPKKYPVAGERPFLDGLAGETLKEALAIRDPESRLKVLGAAAALRGFDAGAVYKALTERAKKGESLFDTYLRNRMVPK